MKELRQNTEYGSTLEVVYDVKGVDLKYETAANLALFPENESHIVERAAKALKINLD
jgi:NADPH-ferrihemoprotein reductase